MITLPFVDDPGRQKSARGRADRSPPAGANRTFCPRLRPCAVIDARRRLHLCFPT